MGLARMDIIEITAGIRAGDENAFNAFHDAYSERMFRYLIVTAHGDEFAARDVLQESLLRVIRHMKVMPSDEDLWRYLAVIMRSAWTDRQRGLKTAERHSKTLKTLTRTESVPESEMAATDELHTLLSKAMGDLPDEERQLIEEHYFEGHSQYVLAAARVVPVKTMAMRFVRLRRKLRDSIMRGLRLE